MLKLQYGGNDNISNEDGQIILRTASIDLARNLTNSDNNGRVLLIFESKGILDRLESETIRRKLETCTTSAWITEFYSLLLNRSDICGALNLLLNLDNDADLRNYRRLIRRTFEALKLPKRLEVIEVTLPDPCQITQTINGAESLSDKKAEEEPLLLSTDQLSRILHDRAVKPLPRSHQQPESHFPTNDTPTAYSSRLASHSSVNRGFKNDIKRTLSVLAITITAMIATGATTQLVNPIPMEHCVPGINATISTNSNDLSLYSTNCALTPTYKNFTSEGFRIADADTAVKLKLRYDGNDNISNSDGKLILNRACLELSRNLTNAENNSRVLLIFKSEGILDPLETEAISRRVGICSTSDWITQFCLLLENRADICEALNLLLNLDNDPDLKNYRVLIQRIFESIKLPKQLEVMSIISQTEQTNQTVKQSPDAVIRIEGDEHFISHNQILNSVAGSPPQLICHFCLNNIASSGTSQIQSQSYINRGLNVVSKPIYTAVAITIIIVLLITCGLLISVKFS